MPAPRIGAARPPDRRARADRPGQPRRRAANWPSSRRAAAPAAPSSEELGQAIHRLRGSIGSLNREGRARLLAAFEEVDAPFPQPVHRPCSRAARRISSWSNATIRSRPGSRSWPSRRASACQSLTLLSGGEQALTAIALIFALFLTNPAPICVLDEVDAPLDDANIERFCDLLDRMTGETDTRYLIVTHNAVTMSRMHRLFGVTMIEKGVSRLVSVDLGGAEDAAGGRVSRTASFLPFRRGRRSRWRSGAAFSASGRGPRSTAGRSARFAIALYEAQRARLSRSTSCSTPTVVQHVLLDNAANYVKPDIVKQLLGADHRPGLLSSDGELWREQRQDRRRQLLARRGRRASAGVRPGGAEAMARLGGRRAARHGGRSDADDHADHRARPVRRRRAADHATSAMAHIAAAIEGFCEARLLALLRLPQFPVTPQGTGGQARPDLPAPDARPRCVDDRWHRPGRARLPDAA